MARPTLYDERKENKKIRITPTAWEGLELFAQSLDLPVSEMLERLGRGTIAEPDYKEFLKSLKRG